jgi:hypothetical protein
MDRIGFRETLTKLNQFIQKYKRQKHVSDHISTCLLKHYIKCNPISGKQNPATRLAPDFLVGLVRFHSPISYNRASRYLPCGLH